MKPRESPWKEFIRVIASKGWCRSDPASLLSYPSSPIFRMCDTTFILVCHWSAPTYSDHHGFSFLLSSLTASLVLSKCLTYFSCDFDVYCHPLDLILTFSFPFRLSLFTLLIWTLFIRLFLRNTTFISVHLLILIRIPCHIDVVGIFFT